MQLFFFQNVIAPYRTHIFETFSAVVNTFVFYGTTGSPDRRMWKQRRPNAIAHAVGAMHMQILGRNIQPFSGVVLSLLRRRPSHVISITSRSNFLDVALLFLFSRIIGSSFVIWYAGVPKWDPVKNRRANRIADAFINFVVRRADAGIFYTNYALECARQLGFTGEAVVGGQFLEPGFADNVILPRANTGKLTALYVGVFDERKGVDILLREVAELDQPGAQLRIILAGGLESDLHRLGLNVQFRHIDVVCLGKVARDEMAGLYAQADVTILPSRYDPWGFVVSESMRCGVPCICSSSAGAHELASKAGWTFDPGKHGELASILTTVSRDEALMQASNAQIAEAAYSNTDAFVRRVVSMLQALPRRGRVYPPV